MATTPFDPTRGKELRDEHVDAHNMLAKAIRLAILLAVVPDPELAIEEKQAICQKNPFFLEALADVCAELVGWDCSIGKADEFAQLFRDWCSDEMHEIGLP